MNSKQANIDKKLKTFLSQYPTKDFSKGSTILLKDVPPKCVYVIKIGIVKVYDITATGDEQPVSFDITGEVFPIGYFIGKIKKTQYFYQAFTDVETYSVPKKELFNFIEEDPEICQDFYKGVAIRHLSLQQRIHALQQSKANDKILFTLKFFCERFGSKVNNSTTRLKIPITQQDIALFLGLTRETTSIELKKLEKLNIVTYDRKNFYINASKLNAAIENK